MRLLPLSSLLLPAVALVFTWGCAGKSAPPSAVPKPPPAPEVVAPASPYFYYTEAQIRLRRNHPEEAAGFLKQAVALDPESAFLRKELAAILVRMQQTEAALREIDAAVALAPDDVEALIAAGGIRQMLGHKLSELIVIYEKVLSMDPERERIYLLLGNLYLAEKQPEKAQEVYQRLIRQKPDNYGGYYYLGQLLAIQGDLAGARKNFVTVIKMVPDLTEPRMEEIKILRRQLARKITIQIEPGDSLNAILAKRFGSVTPKLREQTLALNPLLLDPDHLESGKRLLLPPAPQDPLISEILSAYDEILKIAPSQPDVIMDLALFHRETGNPDAGTTLLAQLARDHKSRETAIRKVIKNYLEKKRYRDSVYLLQGLRTGVTDTEHRAELDYYTGITFDEAGMVPSARKAYAAVPQTAKIYQKAVISLVFLHHKEGNMDAAIALLETASARFPGQTHILFYLGSFYEEQKRLVAAKTTFEKGLRMEPDNLRLRYSLGVVLDKLGRKDDSIREMERLLLMDPKHANAMNYLGYTFADLNIRLDEAETLIRRALSLKPGDGYITDSMGWVLFKKGETEEAIRYLEKAARLIPEDPVVQEHLGDVYAHTGRLDEAKKRYQESLRLKPSETVSKKLSALKAKIDA